MEANNGEGKSCICCLVDDGSVESHRYYLARRTVLEMLRDRGYDIPDSEIDCSLQEFRSTYGQKPDLERIRVSASLLSDPSQKILVVFCGTDKINVRIARGIRNQITGKEELSWPTRVILILQSEILPQARKEVEQFPCKVEFFQITDLLINITKHVLKPKHEILTPEEKEKILNKYSLEDKQMPRMLQSDAIARYYGLEKGQVVKVIYSGEITGSHVTYRCVV
ncbi:PREDICTED: DNA-directed RNA polymerases IV and V subunit 5B-like [Nelumbo nucifera]|uniref:DNA-directed RNA polymerase V subunit 5A n=2 Tax=Nelumbo nucifera TaxID=4432 RepID=A0A822YAS1_NELNU|nr:PREDICTED: DNA-directed RNA polymerases IV and V subunit 5B-like [Nelumbo nucifera]DAD29402.1 TPA_asm: hypothetical protein HUJ06_030870 [Nelumbo nucifera]